MTATFRFSFFLAHEYINNGPDINLNDDDAGGYNGHDAIVVEHPSLNMYDIVSDDDGGGGGNHLQEMNMIMSY